jgi:hypothetical protein
MDVMGQYAAALLRLVCDTAALRLLHGTLERFFIPRIKILSRSPVKWF